MGPMFYLVQLKEARCLISAVILADWPHEFALAILLGKGWAVAAPHGRRRFRLVSFGVALRKRLGS